MKFSEDVIPYMAGILFLLTAYTVYQARHVSVLTAGKHEHFEPMVQTSHEIVGMIEKEGQVGRPEQV